ncbi:MAG: radical SAM protein [Clostridia bacterium]|nr:radical SAM protein [Clostridia bacterium]
MRYYNIPVFVPHLGCPFDCVFCNQKHITGIKEEQTVQKARETIEEHLKTLPKENRTVEIAFFGGSFTGIETEKQIELLSVANEFLKKGEIDGIRLSTRPDYIDDTIMERLLKYGVTTIELGVQSMDDGVLLKSGRGHTEETVKNAVSVIRKYPVKLGLQMMTGLPGDDIQKSIKTAETIIALKPDMVRIYPTLVIKDTALADMYRSGTYEPQSLENAVELSKELIKMFRTADIDIIRVGLAATDEISPDTSVVAGPYHSAFGELCESAIIYDEIIEMLGTDKEATILVNPKDISKAIGNKKTNLEKFKKLGLKIEFVQDDKVNIGEIIRKD